MGLDAAAIRKDFPILSRTVNGKPLVYLDNAATSQKPKAVIDALTRYYTQTNANIHRGVHTLAAEAERDYDAARAKVARFVNAPGEAGVIFTRNTTEAINLVAYAWAREHLKPGDEIVVTLAEHHSNYVPWQLAARDTGATLRFLDVTDDGLLRMDELEGMLTARTRLVCVGHASNVLGTIHPVRRIVDLARRAGAKVLVDGAQAVPHMPVDVQALGCDFYAFSAHKMLGPTGIGVLWGREDLLQGMRPFLSGGDMIREVKRDTSSWNVLPYKFEAGTPNIADTIAFGAAIDYLAGAGMEAVRAHEVEITRYALAALAEVPGITIYGPRDAESRGGVVAFNLEGIHPHDLGTILDQQGIAIRAGHHCAQPLMRRLNCVATARASFYLYNTLREVDCLVEGLAEAARIFGGKARAAVR